MTVPPHPIAEKKFGFPGNAGSNPLFSTGREKPSSEISVPWK
jgi:hypothetical protein